MTQRIRELGVPPLSRDEMKASLPEFLRVLAARPIANNQGGMRAPHLFGTWCLLRKLQPTHVVESGVFKGLGTWLIEQALPEARLFCIDPQPQQLVYRSARAEYETRDFSELSLDFPRDRTLLFFDDHQDAFARVERAVEVGFRHLIFEDNYPSGQGDCYSLKKAFMGEGRPAPGGVLGKLSHAARQLLRPEPDPGAYLEQTLTTYFEFPPVRRAAQTRWGDAWDDARYPTPEPLFAAAGETDAVFDAEADQYTWICYAEVAAARAAT